MQSYKYCLFDVDGTLLDTMDLIYHCFVHTCRRWGDMEIKRETVFSHVGIPLLDQLKLYLGTRPDEEYRRIADSHMEYQATVYSELLRIFPGVHEGLESLKQSGIRMGIVTSRTRPSLMQYLRHFGIEDYFEVIATPETTRRHKPHPEPLVWVLKALGALPHEALFVGDAVYDMQCGEAAGVATGFAQWGPNDIETLPVSPDYLLPDFSALLPLFTQESVRSDRP